VPCPGAPGGSATVSSVANRAVIFDYFGTLTTSTPAGVWEQLTERSAAPLGIPPDQWRRVLRDSLPERATGKLGGLQETIRVLAARCGAHPSPAALAAAVAARRDGQWPLIAALRPDAEPTLRVLHAHAIPVGVLSECTVELADAWPSLPIAGLVTARVLSCEEGRRKPDLELYRTAARRVGAVPRDCLYVGDGGDRELPGAVAAGMTAYLLRDAGWHDGKARERQQEWPGPVLSALAEVLPVLGLAK
jgi:putative hydrolase of the HAD superfamily